MIWEKIASQRGQTSKFNDGYTLFVVFQNAQGSQKGVKMRAKMEPPGIQKLKNPKTRALEKND